jgi:hypothetical protein
MAVRIVTRAARRSPLRDPRVNKLAVTQKAGCRELGEMAENRGDELAIRNQDGHLNVAATQKKLPKPTLGKKV